MGEHLGETSNMRRLFWLLQDHIKTKKGIDPYTTTWEGCLRNYLLEKKNNQFLKFLFFFQQQSLCLQKDRTRFLGSAHVPASWAPLEHLCTPETFTVSYPEGEMKCKYMPLSECEALSSSLTLPSRRCAPWISTLKSPCNKNSSLCQHPFYRWFAPTKFCVDTTLLSCFSLTSCRKESPFQPFYLCLSAKGVWSSCRAIQ